MRSDSATIPKAVRGDYERVSSRYCCSALLISQSNLIISIYANVREPWIFFTCEQPGCSNVFDNTREMERHLQVAYVVLPTPPKCITDASSGMKLTLNQSESKPQPFALLDLHLQSFERHLETLDASTLEI